jgi:hypothetical protein
LASLAPVGPTSTPQAPLASVTGVDLNRLDGCQR